MACDHSTAQSGGLRYLRDTGELQLVLVCDVCGLECSCLNRIEYAPRPRRLVGHLAELTARELGLDEEQVSRVRFAALVCGQCRDQLPPEVVGKAGPLSDEEWAQVRHVPELGAALLTDVTLEHIREWILCYRERPDGSGYPRGLHGDEIPLESRILAVTDAYTAIISDRAHRPARSHQQACAELERCAGTQFDARVVEAFLEAVLHRNPHLAHAAA